MHVRVTFHTVAAKITCFCKRFWRTYGKPWNRKCISYE